MAAEASYWYNKLGTYAAVGRQLKYDPHIISFDLKRLGFLGQSRCEKISTLGWTVVKCRQAYLTKYNQPGRIRYFVSHHHKYKGKFIGAWLADASETCVKCLKPVPKQIKMWIKLDALEGAV